MKNSIILSVVLALCAGASNADYYRTSTNNCDPAAMHAVLDRAVREHRAVITEVNCESVRVEPVVVAAPAPAYTSTYVAPAVDYSNIPVVDCVPYPTSCEYCAGRY
ncbi:MAG: hypothetical protein J6Y07_01815 [Alphaproteobacteria bacterium]|nr:hypothetical protein [Alphaproteobacteria bacterium]